MNFFKRFAKDFSNLSRFHFACKYIFPAFAIFLTWGSLGNFYQTQLNKTQLVKNSGLVSDIEVVFQQGTKPSYKYYPLLISLVNSSNSFRLRDKFTDWFSFLQDKIHVGDTIEIYTRTKFQTLIGWGKQNDIYQIEKGNQLIFPISVVTDYNASQARALLFLALLFWSPFIFFKFRVIKPK